jgi:catechol 2,3-dioxygenase-like lactoylglutathione lyase family enzyme
MPNLENLRKQAKLYVRWHRAGYHPVAAQIRAVLPRYRDMTDQQVLAEPFKLSDAQEVIARQTGFDSWQALKTGVQEMSESTATTKSAAVLTNVEPQLFVADVKLSCEFYVSKLGFDVVFTYGEPPFYGQVQRDSALLNLRRITEPVFVGDIRERDHLLSASIGVGSNAQLRQLFLEFQSAGVDFHQDLRHEPWGTRTFVVRDPDANLLLFAAPSE